MSKSTIIEQKETSNSKVSNNSWSQAMQAILIIFLKGLEQMLIKTWESIVLIETRILRMLMMRIAQVITTLGTTTAKIYSLISKRRSAKI